MWSGTEGLFSDRQRCVSTSTGGHLRPLTNVMLKTWFCGATKLIPAFFPIVLVLCGPAAAQQISLASFRPEAMRPPAFVKPVEPITLPERSRHQFWDRKNTLLFATTAGLNTADFFATRHNLRNGGRELNPLTRPFASSTAGLAANFAGETAGVIGLSYLFHKSGHHKLERVVSILNVGASATAVTFDLVHP